MWDLIKQLIQKYYSLSFPGGSVVKNLPANAEDMGLILMCQEDPMEMEMTTHSSILAWETP